MSTSLRAMLAHTPKYPRRVVCLTDETTETLYRIGAQDLIVGVSGFSVRPPEARNKPHVSSFLDANFDQILELKPDVVVGFSDLQAELGAELARRGVPVVLFNQRSVAEILQTVRATCALVGRAEEGEALAARLLAHVEEVADRAAALTSRPRVFFEEWHEPLTSGIRWCSELVELAGGEDICLETRTQQGARGRTFDPKEIARRDPEVVIGSWCGQAVIRQKIVSRPGWGAVSAVKNNQLYEINSPLILQPGPACLTDGLDQLAAIISAASRGERHASNLLG